MTRISPGLLVVGMPIKPPVAVGYRCLSRKLTPFSSIDLCKRGLFRITTLNPVEPSYGLTHTAIFGSPLVETRQAHFVGTYLFCTYLYIILILFKT